MGPLKICTWNVQGLKNKQGEIKVFIKEHDVDIYLLSETKLSVDVEFEVSGYKFYRACHPDGGRRGGSGVLIRNSIIHKPLQEIVLQCDHGDSNKRYVACAQVARLELEIRCTNYQIGAFYAPSGHAMKSNDFMGIFHDMGLHFLLGGDFNAHHESWGINSRPDTVGKQLHLAITQLELEIMAPTFYTRIPNQAHQKSSVLDFFIGKDVKDMCSGPQVVENIKTTTDHKPVLITVRIDDTGPSSSGEGQQGPYSSPTHDAVLRVDTDDESSSINFDSPPIPHSFTFSSYIPTDEPFKVIAWDSQGLVGKEHELFQFAELADVLMISFTGTFPESLVIPDFKIYTSPGALSGVPCTGGSAILIGQSISHSSPFSGECLVLQTASICIDVNNKPFRLGAIHINPNQFWSELVDGPYWPLLRRNVIGIFRHLETEARCGFMVGGGFNAIHERWGCDKSDIRGKILFDIMEELQLELRLPPINLQTFFPERNELSEVRDFVIGKFLPESVGDPSILDSSSEHKPILFKFRI